MRNQKQKNGEVPSRLGVGEKEEEAEPESTVTLPCSLAACDISSAGRRIKALCRLSNVISH